MSKVRAIVMSRAALALAFAPMPGHAEPLPAGVYAVSSCGVMGRGASIKAALKACDRAVAAARRRHDINRDARCACTRHADVVHLEEGRPPAFFASRRLQTGPTRESVARRCRESEKADHAAEPQIPQDPRFCDEVRAAYGPFDRKPAWMDLDDARAYRYLTEAGTWVDETGNPVCFAAGTPVLTPDGPRPIEAIAVGDAVLSWSAERGGPVVAKVVRTKQRPAHEILRLELADGTLLRLTRNHPLFVPGRDSWIPAGDLRAGDRVAVLAVDRLIPVEVTSVIATATDEDVDVYDLTIEPTHAYFAGGVWAHNY